MEITREQASKVLAVVDQGLTRGLGIPVPGLMCVEAAVCYALGLPHSDDSGCEGAAARRFKIGLNDAAWSSKASRTAGLRKLAIAQLGSDIIDQSAFALGLSAAVVRQIVPPALRAVAAIHKVDAQRQALEAAAVRCEVDGTKEAAREAQRVTAPAAYGGNDGGPGAYVAYAAYVCATYAYVASVAAAAGINHASGSACAAAVIYAADASDSRDRVLTFGAEMCIQILKDLDSPGWAFLGLTE